MKAVGNSYEVKQEQGFDVYVLRNQQVEIAVVPELGARIISLKDLDTGREWLWHPASGRKLFRNRAGDDFQRSPLVGVDECFPTIAPCQWQGRPLPDHGELWAAPWAVDQEVWEKGRLRASARLKISPFDFERTIELRENKVRLNYRLNSRSKTEEFFLWALHPLLRLQPGDDLELPSSTRRLLNGAAWVAAVDAAVPSGNCEKIFAWPVSKGLAVIHNPETEDRLAFQWEAVENNTLGLWLTRGGWHGHHHFALEPANGEPDALAAAVPRKRCGAVAGHGSATWAISIQVGT